MFFFGLSNGLLLLYHLFFNPDWTNRDSLRQIRTVLAALTCPKIALHSNNYKKCTSYD